MKEKVSWKRSRGNICMQSGCIRSAYRRLAKNDSTTTKNLEANGFGIYCIDYTQDFEGVLDRKTLAIASFWKKNATFEAKETLYLLWKKILQQFWEIRV